jgi:hypothetical protein
MEHKRVLVLSEQNPVLFDFSEFAQAEFSAEGEGIEIVAGWRTLAEDFEMFLFSYAGKPGPNGSFTWESSWDSRERGRLPAAVRLTMQTEKDALPVDLVVRIPVGDVWSTIRP